MVYLLICIPTYLPIFDVFASQEEHLTLGKEHEQLTQASLIAEVRIKELETQVRISI